MLRVLLVRKALLVFPAEVPEHPSHEGYGQTCRNDQKRVEFDGLHRGDSRFRLPLSRGLIRLCGKRETVLLQQKSQAVRNEYAIHKGFIRGGAPQGAAYLQRRRPQKHAPRLDTEPATRILSWKAFFLDLYGESTGNGAFFVSGSSDWGSQKNAVSNRKQTVAG